MSRVLHARSKQPLLQVGGEYVANFARLQQTQWDELLDRFDDASLFQTAAYEVARSKTQELVHMVLKRGGEVVAAAQARVVALPVLRAGIAYVRWGPVWRLRGAPPNVETLQQALRALRNEFSARRRLVLRIYPLAFVESDQTVQRVLREEGFASLPTVRNERTLVLDLTSSLEELRANLDRNWRNKLNQAERSNLDIVSGDGQVLFDQMESLVAEMTARKHVAYVSDIPHLRRAQPMLPDHWKLKVLMCYHNGQPAAGGIFAAIGDTGLVLVRATGDIGLRTRGSYLVQWNSVKWLLERGIPRYDLNGINPEANPGTYRYKKGLAGKIGRDVHFLGRYQVTDSGLSSLVVRLGEVVSNLSDLRANVKSVAAQPDRDTC